MDKWERLACGHIYDPAVGDPDRGELVCSIVLPRNALETPLGYPIEGTTTHAWIEHLHFDTRGDTMNMVYYYDQCIMATAMYALQIDNK